MWRFWLYLAAVMVAIGVFAAGVFLVMDKPGGNNRWLRAESEMGEIQKALIQYWMEHKRYPETLAALTEKQFRGGVPKDPFSKTDYHYVTDGQSFVLICLGKDLAPGGEHEADVDIVFTENGRLFGR